MDELELKKKIIEWLTLREESKALRKAQKNLDKALSGRQVKAAVLTGIAALAPHIITGISNHFHNPDRKMAAQQHDIQNKGFAKEHNIQDIWTKNGKLPAEDRVDGGEREQFHQEHAPKIDTMSAKKSEAPPQSTAHVWDKSQQPRLTATGFLPKYKPQPKVQKPMAKATISPAMTSAPILVNRVDNNTPKQIDQPNIINPYKDIFSSLKNRKGK